MLGKFVNIVIGNFLMVTAKMRSVKTPPRYFGLSQLITDTLAKNVEVKNVNDERLTKLACLA